MKTVRKKQDKWLTQAQYDNLQTLEDGVVYHITDAKVDYLTEIVNKPTLGTAAAKDAGTQNGVADLDANGKVPFNELPLDALTGSSAPTTSTTANYVGQWYLDTTNNKTYQCTAITSDGATPPTYTYTWAQIIRKTDIIGSGVLGIAQIGSSDLGIGTYNDGRLFIAPASPTEITNRSAERRPITPNTLNDAVKSALTDANHLTMTSAEQSTAKSVLGITGQSNAVSYDAQTPTSAEQEQARANIDAAQFSAYNYHNNLGSGAGITNCTTLEQIITLAINNPTTILVGNIGNDPGTQPLRTLLGFPNGGFGNYVDVISTSYQKLSATNMKVLELMAYDLYNNKTAKGYIYVNYSGQNLDYHWSGWVTDDNVEKVETIWTGVLNNNYTSSNSLNIDLSAYKRVRFHFQCFNTLSINYQYGTTGGVVEMSMQNPNCKVGSTVAGGYISAGMVLPYQQTLDTTPTIDYDMSVNVIYSISSHNIRANFSYYGSAAPSSASDAYYVYRIEGIR